MTKGIKYRHVQASPEAGITARIAAMQSNYAQRVGRGLHTGELAFMCELTRAAFRAPQSDPTLPDVPGERKFDPTVLVGELSAQIGAATELQTAAEEIINSTIK